jgi:hypothetical protein
MEAAAQLVQVHLIYKGIDACFLYLLLLLLLPWSYMVQKAAAAPICCICLFCCSCCWCAALCSTLLLA